MSPGIYTDEEPERIQKDTAWLDYPEVGNECPEIIIASIEVHCSDISQYTLRLCEKDPVPMPENFMAMLKVMRQMVYDSITAISENDVELAQKVMTTDDEVDTYFRQMRQELTSLMQQYPQLVPQYVDYLMIAKYVERIADHATNIAQWVLFVVRNELKS